MIILDGFKYSAIVASYPNLGYLPIVCLGDREVYRGEYQRTREEAVFKAFKFIDEVLNA